MQFTLGSLLVVGLAGLASAAPLNTTSSDLVQRDGSKAYCAYKFHPTFPYVGVYVPNNLMSSAQGNGECKFYLSQTSAHTYSVP